MSTVLHTDEGQDAPPCPRFDVFTVPSRKIYARALRDDDVITMRDQKMKVKM